MTDLLANSVPLDEPDLLTCEDCCQFPDGTVFEIAQCPIGWTQKSGKVTKASSVGPRMVRMRFPEGYDMWLYRPEWRFRVA
jgi:hypothetical protein